jgi:hypothetical protein
MSKRTPKPLSARLAAVGAALFLAAALSGCAGLEQQSDAELERLMAWLDRTHGPAGGWQSDPDDPALRHY